jgi:hypothetical protein
MDKAGERFMPNQNEKAHLLDSSGYIYNFDRMMYINRQVKKAFSFEFVDDNSKSAIETKIGEMNGDGEWRFYTSLPMSEGTKKELKRVLQ